jgi:hypothetical protein
MSDPALRLKDLVNSSDWKEFASLLKEHKETLDSQTLQKVEKREFEEAYGLRLRAIEAAKILQAVDGRLSELLGMRKKEEDDDVRT